jgi:hypothetical protein
MLVRIRTAPPPPGERYQNQSFEPTEKTHDLEKGPEGGWRGREGNGGTLEVGLQAAGYWQTNLPFHEALVRGETGHDRRLGVDWLEEELELEGGRRP